MIQNKMIDSVCRQNPIVSASQQIALFEKWKETGDKRYFDKLILSNMKLVISETHKIKSYNPNLSYDDLFQEGLNGLLKAASKFDTSRDASFVTYAMWWIRAYQKRFTMDNRSLVRLGTTRDGRIMFANLAKARAKAESLGLTGFDKIKKISEIIGVETESVEQMLSILSGYDSSLDTPIGEDKDTYIVDTIPDAKEEHLKIDSIIEDSLSGKVSIAMSILPDDEKYIIQKRFLSSDPMTFRDLANELKISREWVRKLEIRALGRLKRYMAREFDIREI